MLAAVSDQAAVQVAFDQMIAAFEPSGPDSDAFFVEMKRNATMAEYECGFKTANRGYFLVRVVPSSILSGGMHLRNFEAKSRGCL